ncbi:Protein of unknown function [Thalassolituus maritimus]|uniref:DUF3530 domain-containing protein n=1 Tax=Thalassolituus maritimus TaxID=484498 RepID=A0A1N7IZH5_9GAMM|nr:DUF3530 family protein [Thalassolituus maritimus]SIS42515.1 Protein of unknown function [Thalassolituus maritimus]
MSLIRDISDTMKPMFACRFATCLLLIAVSLPAFSEEEENESTPPEETAEQATDDSGSPAPVAPVRALPYPDSERHQSIIEHLALFQRSDEVVTLVAGPDSFHGLFLREQSGRPQGGALILHDIEQHAHWPELVAPLREALTDYGWTTLAIELPTAPVERLPIRQPVPTSTDAALEGGNTSEDDTTEEDTANEDAEPANDEPTQEDADGTAIQDIAPDEGSVNATTESDLQESDTGLTAEQKRKAYTEGIAGRIRSGLGYLASRGQLNNVVIAHGDSAVWAANAVQTRQRETENSNGLVLVLVDPREHPLSPLRLSQVLETLEVPVLDILTAEARSSSWQDKQRMGAMKRRHRDRYQQIHLSSASADSNTVLRRIRGWLRTNAAGTELP